LRSQILPETARMDEGAGPRDQAAQARRSSRQRNCPQRFHDQSFASGKRMRQNPSRDPTLDPTQDHSQDPSQNASQSPAQKPAEEELCWAEWSSAQALLLLKEIQPTPCYSSDLGVIYWSSPPPTGTGRMENNSIASNSNMAGVGGHNFGHGFCHGFDSR
jgi:hypothetical protein